MSKLHLFTQRMFQIFHSKDDTPAQEMLNKWDDLLKDIDEELLSDEDLQFNQQELEKFKVALKNRDIKTT